MKEADDYSCPQSEGKWEKGKNVMIHFLVWLKLFMTSEEVKKVFFKLFFFLWNTGRFAKFFFFFFSFLKTGGKKVFAVSEQNLFSPVFTDKIKISSLEKWLLATPVAQCMKRGCVLAAAAQGLNPACGPLLHVSPSLLPLSCLLYNLFCQNKGTNNPEICY